MSSRNERRRRARQRQAEGSATTASHGVIERSYKTVAKAVQSRQQQVQDTDGFSDMYGQDKVVKPPLPLERLWELTEVNAIHSACIEAKVADSVGRGWRLEAEDPDADGWEDEAKQVSASARQWLHSITRGAILDEGNAAPFGFNGMIRQIVREKEAVGWGAWEVLREGGKTDGKAPIAAILPVPPQAIRCIKDQSDLYMVERGKQKVYFKRFGCEKDYSSTNGQPGGEGDDAATELLIFKHYNPRTPFYGIPPWAAAIPPAAEFTAIREYNLSWFESGGTTDRLIHVDSDDASIAGEVADSIVDQLADAEGVGHTTLVTHGSKDTSIQVEHLTQLEGKRDGQFQNRREDVAKEILVAHQVPSYRIGWAIVGDLGGNAAEEMTDTYEVGVVGPLQEGSEEDLAATLFNPDVGGFDLRGFLFKFNSMDGDEPDTIAEVAGAVANGAMTPNQGLERMGYDRIEDDAYDQLYYQGTPLTDSVGLQQAQDVVDTLEKALRGVLVQKETEDELEPAETRKRLWRRRP